MKDVKIKLKSIQIVDNEQSVVELTTIGGFEAENNNFVIKYNEDAEQNLGKTSTTLVVENDSVTLIRSGDYCTHIVIEKNKRHLCHYNTPYGDMMMGISTQYIENDLTKLGGNLSFKYDVDIDSNFVTTNEIIMNIEEC